MSDREEIDAIISDIKSEEAEIANLKCRAADSQDHAEIISFVSRIDARFAKLRELKADLKCAIEIWQP